MFDLRKKNVFDRKPKMTKTFEFENLKFSNLEIWSFLGDFQIFKFNFFCHFWFPIKTKFVSQSKHTFVLPKQFWG